MTRCRFCGIELEREGGALGRVPVYCSKHCRQADYRERKQLVEVTVRARHGRRFELRFRAELKSLADLDRQRASAAAWERSRAAWPPPVGLDSWPEYLERQKALAAAASDEMGVSSL